MRLAEYSVPKMSSAVADEDGTGGPFFCSLAEGVSAFARRHQAAKMLVVSDRSTYKAVAALPKNPRYVFLVLDAEDCLPLFSMPDGVSCVLAAGRASLLRAARYFAEVRGVPCAVFPVSGALDGAYEGEAELLCGGVRTRSALSESEVFCDCTLLNAAEGYARLLLGRLALFEARVLRAFRFSAGNPRAEESVFPIVEKIPVNSEGKEIALRNAKLREAEREGAYAGEGIFLARKLKSAGEPNPEWNAFWQLSALYFCFFAYGRPRRYLLPDYSARADAAGIEYRRQTVPTEAEFASRALALEAMRGAFTAEITALRGRRDERTRAFLALGGTRDKADVSALKSLPEFSFGLSSLVRDFGLMEW